MNAILLVLFFLLTATPSLIFIVYIMRDKARHRLRQDVEDYKIDCLLDARKRYKRLQ